MLDFQTVMLSRVVSHKRVHGLPRVESQGLAHLLPFLGASRRKVMAFLAKPVNTVIGQRFQNRHRSLEGIT